MKGALVACIEARWMQSGHDWVSVVCWVFFFSCGVCEAGEWTEVTRPWNCGATTPGSSGVGEICVSWPFTYSIFDQFEHLFRTYDFWLYQRAISQFQVDLVNISNTIFWLLKLSNVRCLYAFLKPGSSIHDLPADKLPMARPSQQESLILDILGKERAEEPGQLQMALKFMSELKQTLGLTRGINPVCRHTSRCDFWFENFSLGVSADVNRNFTQDSHEPKHVFSSSAVKTELDKTYFPTPWEINATISRQRTWVK